MNRQWFILACGSITAVAGLEATALALGVDGVALAASIGTLGALGGASVRGIWR